MDDSIIQQIANVAKNAIEKVYLSDLTKIIGGSNARGTARRVSAAYKYFVSVGDQKTADLIAETFVNRYGEPAWEKNHKH